jgi:hypothetical protein
MRRLIVQIRIRSGSVAFRGRWRNATRYLAASPCSHRPQPPIGLCSDCMHARVVDSAKGSRFWRCARSSEDARFPKYPRLPVLLCQGFELRPDRADEKP